MSSVVTAEAAAAAGGNEVKASGEEAVEKKAPRRFPLPCWTQGETLVLIGAYRERWYAARRGYLRTADWDAVAEVVAERCPDASPAKTSAQCRHKMEKLRQRYRAEKQRALAFPSPAGRYLSSWFFFENMEAMENGTTPPDPGKTSENPSDGSQLNSYLEQNLLKFKLKAKNNPESTPDSRFENSVQAMRLGTATNAPIDYPPYINTEIADRDKEGTPDFINTGFEIHPTNRIPIAIPPLKSISKKSGKMFNEFASVPGFHQQIPPPGWRMKQYGSAYTPNNNGYSHINNIVDPGKRSKYWSSINPTSDPGSAIRGSKRGRNGLEEIVASIKLLGDGFVKMEREKMEVAREIEVMRMKMEMKRNQVLLESQKEIVDAFLKGLFELKKIKKKAKSSGVAEGPGEP